MALNYNNGGAWNYHVYSPIGSAALTPYFSSPDSRCASGQVPNSAPLSQEDSTHCPGPTSDSANQQSDVYLKIFGPKNKKDFTMYTLRNFSAVLVHSPKDVKEAIFTQVGETVVSRKLDFQVGYYNKASKLWLNDVHDVQAALALLKRNRKLTFWCVGLESTKHADNDSDNEDGLEQMHVTKKRRITSTSEERATRVTELKTQLRQKHGPKYSGVQYALWAEMIVGGTHEDMDEPPPVPMFSAQRPRGKPGSSALTDALTNVADRLVTALSPVPTPTHNPPSGILSSPGKSVELRGKYIQQLKDLVNLREIGALTNDEYEEQRLVLVGLMRKL